MREREIGNAVEKIAKARCNEYLQQERKMAQKSKNHGEMDGVQGIAVSDDMG